MSVVQHVFVCVCVCVCAYVRMCVRASARARARAWQRMAARTPRHKAIAKDHALFQCQREDAVVLRVCERARSMIAQEDVFANIITNSPRSISLCEKPASAPSPTSHSYRLPEYRDNHLGSCHTQRQIELHADISKKRYQQHFLRLASLPLVLLPHT